MTASIRRTLSGFDETMNKFLPLNLVEVSSSADQSAATSARIPAVSDEASADRGVYSIGAVARMLEIPAATIRNWEERYVTIVPERSPGGHRLYSREQVEQLRFIAAQVDARAFGGRRPPAPLGAESGRSAPGD